MLEVLKTDKSSNGKQYKPVLVGDATRAADMRGFKTWPVCQIREVSVFANAKRDKENRHFLQEALPVTVNQLLKKNQVYPAKRRIAGRLHDNQTADSQIQVATSEMFHKSDTVQFLGMTFVV